MFLFLNFSSFGSFLCLVMKSLKYLQTFEMKLPLIKKKKKGKERKGFFMFVSNFNEVEKICLGLTLLRDYFSLK